MIELTSNNAKTTLAQSFPTGSTSLALASGTGALFPQPGTTNYPLGSQTFFRLSLTDAATQTKREIVYVTARTGDTLTVLRGQDGTTPINWAVGDIAGLFVVAGTVQNVLQAEQAQAGYIDYATAGGTPNALAISFNPALIENLTPGLKARILIGSNNTGPVTLNVDGLGAVPVVNSRGLALAPNELVAGVIFDFEFTGTQFTVNTKIPELLLQDSSSTANVIKVTTGIGLTQIGRGFVLYVTVANTNTGPVTMTVDGIPNLTTLSREGAAFQGNVLFSGNTYRFIYNGVAFISDAANKSDAFVGEVRMWGGVPANIPATFGFGWHLCDGTYGTPDLTNKFILGAGKTVSYAQQGGSFTTSLSVANLPAHAHAVTDNGHAHNVSDGGHSHSVSDGGHAHGVSDGGHAHGVADGGHSHTINRGGWGQAGQDNGGIAGASIANQYGTYSGTMSTVTASSSNIGIYAATANIGIYSSTTGVGVNRGTTGVAVVTNTTGISIQNTGNGQAFTTTPPYFALCFVMYTGA